MNEGALAEAAALLREAIDLRKALAREHPERLTFRSDLAESHHDLAVVARQSGEMDSATTAIEDARAIYQELAKEHPETAPTASPWPAVTTRWQSSTTPHGKT